MTDYPTLRHNLRLNNRAIINVLHFYYLFYCTVSLLTGGTTRHK